MTHPSSFNEIVDLLALPWAREKTPDKLGSFLWRRERDAPRWEQRRRSPRNRERFLFSLPCCPNPEPRVLIHRFQNEKRPTYRLAVFHGGERGIRTLGTIASTHDFESCAFDQLSHLSVCDMRVAREKKTFNVSSSLP